MTLTTSIRGSMSSQLLRLAFGIFYLRPKFVDSRFNRSGDMIAGGRGGRQN